MSGTPTEDSDSRDMAALASGHDEALDALMDRHGSRVYQYLLRILHDAGEAEETAQEVFVKLYHSRNRFERGRRFTSFLYAIATNAARDRLRRRRRRPESPPLPPIDQGANTPDPAPDPGQQAVEREMAAMVRHAIGSLPEDLRMVILLSEYEGLSHAEIGQALGCSPKAVEMRLYRGRQGLKRDLAHLLARSEGAVPSEGR